MQDLKSFFSELQRRHVVRAAIAHIVAFWLLIQVADVVLPYVGIVDEPVRWALIAGIALFPVTLVIAWFFEHPWQKYTRSRLAIDAVVILLVFVTAGTWVLRNLPEVVHKRTSIVILPFEHAGDMTGKSLSRALAYEVNSLLMKSRSIDVIGIESTMSSALEGLDPPGIAHRLDVNHVLTGSVSTEAGLMNIDLRLLDSAGRALWTAVIEDSLDNLFSVQEQIAVAIESRLGAGADAVPVAAVAAERCWMPGDPEALEKYYTARYYIELRTETEKSKRQIREAMALYEELIETHPRFAEAYSGLAWAYAHHPVYDPENALHDWRPVATALAEQALELCPTLTEAIHHTANQYDHPNSWIGAWQQLTAFIDMEPQRFENYQRLARHYRDTGLLDRSTEVAERNFALDPLSVRAIKELAGALQQAGRLDEAIELYDLATELGSTGPNFARHVKKARACGPDFDCRFRAWGLPDDIRRLMVEMTTPPADDAGREAAVALGMQLFEMNPDMATNMLNVTACHADHLTDLFFEVWRAHFDAEVYWFWPNAWNRSCGNVWADPRFVDYVEEAGFVEYWHRVGWPPM
ncbi:MAG TPA: tetratricopeptide repeat protein, partial [Woeseiaceae bacterium]|nr:tetratricopeptide repeat protein [Woeseiaceae bacterium]